MASRGRRPLKPRAGFGANQDQVKDGVHDSILKQARKSGQMNLSGRSLTTVPDKVWRINLDTPEDGRTASMDNADDRWWEQTDLTKLILASNFLTALSEDLVLLPALTSLDVHDNKLASLPKAIGELRNLQRLDLSRNELTELPACVCKIDSLKYLHVEYNKLRELPEQLGNFMFLEDMDVSHNQLRSIPEGIGHLCKLMKLNVSNNKLTTLPPHVGSMNALRQLDASHNEITQLPNECGSLPNLEQFYLRHNHLTDIPVLTDCTALKELHVGNNRIPAITSNHIKHLPAISVLDLRDNKIASLPDEIAQLESLERLDLTNNDLVGLPYMLGTVTTLKSIVVDGNPMRAIRRDVIMRGTQAIKSFLRSRIEEPAEGSNGATQGVQSTTGQSGVIGGKGDGVNAHDVQQSKSLNYSDKYSNSVPEDVWKVACASEVTSINLSKNTFTKLPEGILLLSDHLKELNMGFNKMATLHSDIGLYFHLVSLDLRNNQLADLPADMSYLKDLREITLSCNRLTKLPGVLYSLPKLEILFANDNKIETIEADGIKQLTCLATLDLQNNNIAQVPAELGLCTHIKSLQLIGNAFRIPRPAILAKGTNALLEHLRSKIAT